MDICTCLQVPNSNDFGDPTKTLHHTTAEENFDQEYRCFQEVTVCQVCETAMPQQCSTSIFFDSSSRSMLNSEHVGITSPMSKHGLQNFTHHVAGLSKPSALPRSCGLSFEIVDPMSNLPDIPITSVQGKSDSKQTNPHHSISRKLTLLFAYNMAPTPH